MCLDRFGIAYEIVQTIVNGRLSVVHVQLDLLQRRLAVRNDDTVQSDAEAQLDQTDVRLGRLGGQHGKVGRIVAQDFRLKGKISVAKQIQYGFYNKLTRKMPHLGYLNLRIALE